MARYLLPPGSKTPMQNPNPSLHLIGCGYWTDGHCFNPYMHRRVSGLMRRPSDGFVFCEEDSVDLGVGDPDQPMGRLTWDDAEDQQAPEKEPTIRLHSSDGRNSNMSTVPRRRITSALWVLVWLLPVRGNSS